MFRRIYVKNDDKLKFEEIIGKPFVNKDLINYFEKHFGFDFLDIKWTIQPKKVDQIVASVFDGLVKQLSIVLNHYNCDYIVLSGKPSSLNSTENLFVKYERDKAIVIVLQLQCLL